MQEPKPMDKKEQKLYVSALIKSMGKSKDE